MAKRARKEKTEAERAEIEADRIAAAERTGPYAVEPTPEDEAAYEEQQDEEAAAYEAAEDAAEEQKELDAESEEKVVNSIVKDKFKVKYIENAQAQGLTSKAAKRSNWDWLSQQLATACLSEKGKIEIGAFTDILDANGVDHSRWINKNRGWEGRFRMTGRVALQKIVANSGVLKTPAGTELEAPAEWRERYKTKA